MQKEPRDILREKNEDIVLLTRLDSDDMIEEDMVSMIQRHKFKPRQALTCKKGFLLSSGEKPSIFIRTRWWIGRLLTKLKIK